MNKIDLAPIIFIGFPRSGTTIISEIIFQHEDLAWPSNYQERFPRKISVNHIRPLLDNKLWRLSGQKAQLNHIAWYNKYTFKPAEAYSFWEYITGPNINFSKEYLLRAIASEERKQFIHSSFIKMVRFQNRKRLAFKITGPGRITYLHSIFPDAIFIEIYREPFAVINSLLKVPFWQDKNDRLYWEGAYDRQEKEQAVKWRSSPELLAAFQYRKIRETIVREVESTGTSYHAFSYEDFVDHPEKILYEIMEISKLSKYSDSITKYLQKNKIYRTNNNPDHIFSKNQKGSILKVLTN